MFGQRSVQLELVAAKPDSDFLPPIVVNTFKAYILPANGEHTARLEDLRDVHERGTGFPRRQERGQPVNAELRLARGNDLLRDDVRPAGADGYVQVFAVVIAFFFRGVISCELRLRYPLRLQRYLILRRGIAARAWRTARARRRRRSASGHDEYK